MLSPLPDEDFRAKRNVIPKMAELFLGVKTPPSLDMIDSSLWEKLTVCPNTVAIYATNYYGSTFKDLHDYKYLWFMLIESNNPTQPHLTSIMSLVNEALDATIFNLLHGYYQQALSALRNILDLIIKGAYVSLKKEEFDSGWITGEKEEKYKFGAGCDFIPTMSPFKELEQHLSTMCQNFLFKQKNRTEKYDGGWVRQLYSKLSKYTHSNHNHDNNWYVSHTMFNEENFLQIVKNYQEVLIFCILIIKIIKKNFLPGSGNIETLKKLFSSDVINQTCVLKKAIHYIFKDSTYLSF